MQRIPFDPKNPEHLDPTKFKIHPGTAWDHTMAALRASRSTDPLTNICILLHDIGKKPAYKFRNGKHTMYNHDYIGSLLLPAIATRLSLTADQTAAIDFVIRKHMLMHRLEELKSSTARELVNNPLWNLLKDAGFADEMSRGAEAELNKFNRNVSLAEEKAASIS